MARKKQQYGVATLDFETDPFSFGAEIKPFCAGLYCGENTYVDFWGDDAHVKVIEYLHTIKKPHYVYAHNGGKFDFMFLLYAGLLENPIKVINGRIVSAKVGIHTLRDSFAILPVPLRAHKKDDFDYSKMTRDKRERNKNDILHYLAKDCEYLHEFVMNFINRFGIKLTSASMAFSELGKIHAQEKTGESFDATFRPYYYGGRVECIETGIVSDDWKVYDVNSMYPAVMKNFNHPKGGNYVFTKTRPDARGFLPGPLADKVYFAEITAISNGALPVREKEGLSFPVSARPAAFMACSHEIQVGIETGRLRVIEYKTVRYFAKVQTFGDFVDIFNAEKIDAEKRGDSGGRLLAKLVSNSAYGKFGQNPRNFKDYLLVSSGEENDAIAQGFTVYADYGDFAIWERAADVRQFNNVAIAASITSAARATLLRALSSADRPIYCDTDSIICRGLNTELDATKLGAWKLEARGVTCAIAGKKLYALLDDKGETVKLASKGVRLDAAQIFSLCKGAKITYQKESPAFNIAGQVRYIQRDIVARV